MTLNSPSYFLFLPAVYLVYYFIPDRWRWLLLLITSYGFYASFKAPYLLAVLLMVTAVSYACALRITTNKEEAIRKRWFWVGIIACVAILVLLKYLPFLEAKTNRIFSLDTTFSTAIITIGVSYFSFQAISYLSDVYLEMEEPERHFGYFALYMAFFPKLLQGPIERVGDLLPQLKQAYRFDYDALRSGTLLFTWGLFKKVVIADSLALYVDQVYNHVHDYTGLPLILSTYAYSLQIYYDFSGYTDMARGTGKMFGINLTENFNSPYMATSIADFWRRWHISFSRWILDYLFKPLQIMWRTWGQAGTAVALIITFLISGIWHGATKGFVIWGLLHGIYLAASTYYRPFKKRLHTWLGIDKSKWLKWWQIFVTFNLVSFAWIFFRMGSLNSWYLIRNIPTSLTNQLSKMADRNFLSSQILLNQGGVTTAILILFIAVTVIVSHLRSRYSVLTQQVWVRWPVYFLLAFVNFIYLVIFSAQTKPFVYFQF